MLKLKTNSLISCLSNKTTKLVNIFWFRRDLRRHDNAGLYHALKEGKPVIPIFIFDKNILDQLPENDARVSFIHSTLKELDADLKENFGSSLMVFHSTPSEVFKKLILSHDIGSVFTNKDYEPYAIERDTSIKDLLSDNNIAFNSFKDHVIFEKDEVLKADGTPYTVFTPYKKKWLERLYSKKQSGQLFYLKSYPSEDFSNFNKNPSGQIPTLESLGFKQSSIKIPSKTVNQKLIKNYSRDRDFPGLKGTSRLGIHFRFGTISIRQKARKALKLNDTYLSELIWRDFYSQILQHFPKVITEAFRLKYDRIEWREDPEQFKAWAEGKTGYPIVDAGMRELNATGFMHNRVRMVVASFLTKHLFLNWRLGEAYFAEKLLDFDLASNNGGWQWAAGCGTDAAPYFRIFNPISQQKKFDKDFTYIKKWVPEYGTSEYPEPIVDHKFARERCLANYKAALNA